MIIERGSIENIENNRTPGEDWESRRDFIHLLEDSGFSSKELKPIVHWLSRYQGPVRWSDIGQLPEGFFGFLHDALPDSNICSRAVIIVVDGGYTKLDDERVWFNANLVSNLITSYKASNINPKIKTEIAGFGRRSMLDSDFSSEGNLKKLAVFLNIYNNPEIYKVFSNDAQKLENFISKFRVLDSDFYKLLKIIDKIVKSPHAELHLNGLDESAFLKLVCNATTEDLAGIFKNRSKSILINELARTKGGWDKRVASLPGVIELSGFPVIKKTDLETALLPSIGNIRDLPDNERYKRVTNFVRLCRNRDGELGFRKAMRALVPEYKFDEKMMERIKKRENPVHPLNTLGIAKTVGYEIEFPAGLYNPFVQKMKNEGLFEFLRVLGFKPGVGGHGSLETSPGPFFDPETANLIFELFCDAGIIDLTSFDSHTFHFNTGVRPYCSTNYNLGFTKLIRAMHLTGSVRDVDKRLEILFSPISPNRQNGNSYTELKAFDAVTREDFMWGMKSASYISWALGAWLEDPQESNLFYQKWQLKNVWTVLVYKLDRGLDTLNLGNYLDAEENTDWNVDAVRRHLQRIYPAKSWRYKDINQIGINDPGIKKITLGNKTWPNIAAFAREVVNEAVAKIEHIADDCENQAIRDIREIEGIGGGQKAARIREFEVKYNSPSYAAVKRLLF